MTNEHASKKQWWNGRARGALVLALISLSAPIAACTGSNARSCLDGVCDDPAFPFCDFDGDIAGTPTACIAVSCTPGESDACRGDRAVTCNADGDDYDLIPCEHGCNELTRACNRCEPSTSRCEAGVFQACDAEGRVAIEETCALGCVDGPAPHCAYLEPRYLPDVCDTRATLDELTITSTATFDTDLDQNCTGGVVAQTGGPSICVVRYRTIAIAAGAKLRVEGSRAVAFVSDGALMVAGVLDVSADRSTNGPGGGSVVSGGLGSLMVGGGGGAGFMTTGGAGGSLADDGGAGNGGDAMVNPALLVALIGGPRSAGSEPYFGGGGGGVTLISCRSTVLVTGVIDAGGGGGYAGFQLLGGAMHGGGGGAGGNVVLQGMKIVVSGGVFANGGGGGSGKPLNFGEGGPGADGFPSMTSTGAGGTGAVGGGAGNGGNGGRGGIPPTAGAHPTATGATCGGGGGSVGFLQSYTPAGVTPMLTPTAASPSFQPNGTIRTR